MIDLQPTARIQSGGRIYYKWQVAPKGEPLDVQIEAMMSWFSDIVEQYNNGTLTVDYMTRKKYRGGGM